jgi:hypothetical protein
MDEFAPARLFMFMPDSASGMPSINRKLENLKLVIRKRKSTTANPLLSTIPGISAPHRSGLPA